MLQKSYIIVSLTQYIIFPPILQNINFLKSGITYFIIPLHPICACMVNVKSFEKHSVTFSQENLKFLENNK